MTEIVTPVPKVYPPEKLDHLRLMNSSKICDCIMAKFLVEDMDPLNQVSETYLFGVKYLRI